MILNPFFYIGRWWLRRVLRTEALILSLLDANEERYGLQLVEASNGKLGRGSIYVYLNRLEERGKVVSREEEPAPETGLARRLYKLAPPPTLWKVCVRFGQDDTWSTTCEGTEENARDLANQFIGARTLKNGDVTFAQYYVEPMEREVDA